MKRILAFILVLLMIASVFASCDAFTPSPEETEKKTEASHEKETEKETEKVAEKETEKEAEKETEKETEKESEKEKNDSAQNENNSENQDGENSNGNATQNGDPNIGNEDGSVQENLNPNPSKGLEYELNIDGESYSIVGIGSCTDTDLVIPETYEGLPVTNIEVCAFIECHYLESVAISESVTNIGNAAFAGCDNLMSITISSSVTNIGYEAFSDCRRLVEIINKSNLVVEKNSDDNGYIASHALEVHSGETKIVTQDGYLFYTVGGINYLINYIGTDKNIILPENYNGNNYVIHDYAFSGNNIENVIIPDSVTSVGVAAFSYCDNLISIIIGDGVEVIGRCAFQWCMNITSITIGNNVTMIDEYAFMGCNKLIEVVNNSSLNINLSDIDVHTGLSNLVNKDDFLFYTIDEVNYLVNYIGIDDDITLPENYNGEAYLIRSWAFSGCTSITSIVIPSSVTYIGNCAFSGCNGLMSIKYCGTEEEWNSISNSNDGLSNSCEIIYNYTDE